MNILFVTKGFPSGDDIMDGNYEAVQAKAIAAKGHHVSVLVVREKPVSCIMKWRKVFHRVVDGVDVYEGVCPFISIPIVRRINRYTHLISCRIVFSKIVKEQGFPDIVHGHVVYPSFYALSIKKAYKIPFVITEHWSRICMHEIPLWLSRMSLQTYSKVDRVICVSQALANSIQKNFGIDSVVINNMVNDFFFKTQKIDHNDGKFKFVACGAFRADRLKGFDILVEAFARANLPKNVSLDIIGDGEERVCIEEQIKKLGVSEQIRVLGTKTPEDVSELFCQSDCFVLSSRLETFSIVVIEAMAIGLPIIATRCGGPETFLQPEHGLLVEKENVKALSDAMKYMTDHYTEYNSNSIRKFCYDHYSENVIADQIINVYKQVLSRYK